MKIDHTNRYIWKRLNLSFPSVLHRTSSKNTIKSYVPSCTAKLFIFRSHYSLRTILLPLRCFRRRMGAMWYVRLMILNLAFLKMDCNPNFLPVGVSTPAAVLLCKSITTTAAMSCSKEWLSF